MHALCTNPLKLHIIFTWSNPHTKNFLLVKNSIPCSFWIFYTRFVIIYCCKLFHWVFWLQLHFMCMNKEKWSLTVIRMVLMQAKMIHWKWMGSIYLVETGMSGCFISKWTSLTWWVLSWIHYSLNQLRRALQAELLYAWGQWHWSFYAVSTIWPMCAHHAKVQLYYIRSVIGMGLEHVGSIMMVPHVRRYWQHWHSRCCQHNTICSYSVNSLKQNSS